jgi:arylsulfatase A-like enzyme
MKGNGYATAMIGKWHLGDGAPFHPRARGFDEAVVSTSKHFGFVTTPPTPLKHGEYLADFLTDRAVDFIARHTHRPFFLYVAHLAVHAPLRAKVDHVRKFSAKGSVIGHAAAVYAAMLYGLDESVGRIMSTLKELGLDKTPSSSSRPTTAVPAVTPGPICRFAAGRACCMKAGCASPSSSGGRA